MIVVSSHNDLTNLSLSSYPVSSTNFTRIFIRNTQVQVVPSIFEKKYSSKESKAFVHFRFRLNGLMSSSSFLTYVNPIDIVSQSTLELSEEPTVLILQKK